MFWAVLAVSVPLSARPPAHAPASEQTQAALIAIDVAIQPDPAALTSLQTRASRLVSEKGLPADQRLEIEAAPRITLVQRFVRESDVTKVSAVLQKLAASASALPIKLTAMGYGSTEGIGKPLVVLTVENSRELDALARAAVNAVQPFAVNGGTAAAFIRAPGENIDPDTIRSVEEFVPKSSGSNFVPYLTLGTAHPAFVKVLSQVAFDRFRFDGVSLAIYQLGRLGTAQKRLWGGR